MTNTATLLKDNLPEARGHQALYRLDPPLDGHEYVVVSAVDLHLPDLDSFLGIPYASCETYIFGADHLGNVIDWGELDGSIKNVKDHAAALAAAGYEVQS